MFYSYIYDIMQIPVNIDKHLLRHVSISSLLIRLKSSQNKAYRLKCKTSPHALLLSNTTSCECAHTSCRCSSMRHPPVEWVCAITLWRIYARTSHMMASRLVAVFWLRAGHSRSIARDSFQKKKLHHKDNTNNQKSMWKTKVLMGWE